MTKLDRPILIHCCKDGTITYRTRKQKIFNDVTFIPVAAFKPDPAEASEAGAYLLRRSGFRLSGCDCVFVIRLATGEAEYDECNWGAGSRTMQVAHAHIRRHFDELRDGDVIDVEHIMGLTPKPKTSERLEYP